MKFTRNRPAMGNTSTALFNLQNHSNRKINFGLMEDSHISTLYRMVSRARFTIENIPDKQKLVV